MPKPASLQPPTPPVFDYTKSKDPYLALAGTAPSYPIMPSYPLVSSSKPDSKPPSPPSVKLPSTSTDPYLALAGQYPSSSVKPSYPMPPVPPTHPSMPITASSFPYAMPIPPGSYGSSPFPSYPVVSSSKK